MKFILILLIGITLLPRVGFADEPKAAAVEKKAEAKKADDKKADDKKEDERKAETKPAAKLQPAARVQPAVKAQPAAAAQPAARLQPAAKVREAANKVIEAVGAAAGAAADVVAVDVDPLEQQYAPQFRKVLNAELHFVRTVCQPTPEQYQPIKAAGEVSMKLTLKKFAEVQKKMQQGFRAGEQPKYPDPHKLITEALAQAIKQTLSAGQSQRYDVELEKRAAARRRVVLNNLVAKLDKDLVLTADQRRKFADTLNSNWNDAWGQQLEVFLYGDQYLPVLPDAQVLPLLSDKQKEVWKETPRNQNTIWGWVGFGFVQAMDFEEAAPANADKPEDKGEKKGDSP